MHITFQTAEFIVLFSNQLYMCTRKYANFLDNITAVGGTNRATNQLHFILKCINFRHLRELQYTACYQLQLKSTKLSITFKMFKCYSIMFQGQWIETDRFMFKERKRFRQFIYLYDASVCVHCSVCTSDYIQYSKWSRNEVKVTNFLEFCMDTI